MITILILHDQFVTMKNTLMIDVEFETGWNIVTINTQKTSSENSILKL